VDPDTCGHPLAQVDLTFLQKVLDGLGQEPKGWIPTRRDAQEALKSHHEAEHDATTRLFNNTYNPNAKLTMLDMVRLGLEFSRAKIMAMNLEQLARQVFLYKECILDEKLQKKHTTAASISKKAPRRQAVLDAMGRLERSYCLYIGDLL
jgi:hypothetical protein